VKWKPSKGVLVQTLWIVGIGSFLTVIDPFGATRGLHAMFSWLYWTGFVGYGTLAALFTVPVLQKLLKPWPPLILYLAISLVIALLVSVGILTSSTVIGGPVPVQAWPQLYAYVWVISAAITTVMALRERQNVNPNDQPGAAFNKRIPAKLAGGSLYAINAEDHYLRLHTSRGDALILMRLGDALDELEGVDGLRTHRSWWVAREGVRKVQKQNGKISLELRDDSLAPVSRTYAPALRRNGWF
jgi:LytTr DNA-binding domain